MKKATSLVFLGTLALVTATTSAATVLYGAPSNTTADSDVSTAGVDLYAYNFTNGTGSAGVVNGITFDPISAGNADITFSSVAFVGDNFSTVPTGLATDLGVGFTTLLGGGLFVGGPAPGVGSLTLNNLVVGDTYQVQLFAFRTAGNPDFSVDGNILNANAGRFGQSIIGTFTADAGTQLISLDGSLPFSVGNGVSVRTIPVPEPSSVLLLGLSWLGLLRRRR